MKDEFQKHYFNSAKKLEITLYQCDFLYNQKLLPISIG